MKKILKFMVVVLICGALFLTGCNADTGVATQEPTKEPTLKELVEVFKNVDINYYVSAVKKAFKGLSNVQKQDLENFKKGIEENYSNVTLPSKDAKYTKVTDMGRLTCYPSTTDANDAIIIIKDVTLNTNTKENITIVALQGTDFADGQATGFVEDLLSGLELNNYYLYDVYRAIVDNVEPGEKLLITGVSLGGMVGQQLAGLDIIKEKYDVMNVVALGSPMISPEKIDYNETSVVRICDSNDLVPHLSQSATKEDLEKNVKIERQSTYKSFISAHAFSYVNDELWKNIDVLGKEGGSSFVTFENSEVNVYAAKNYKAYKDKKSK